MKLWQYLGKSLFHAAEYEDGYTEQDVIDELQKRIDEDWGNGTFAEGMFKHNLEEVIKERRVS